VNVSALRKALGDAPGVENHGAIADWGVEGSVVRSDSRGLAAAGSFSSYAFVLIVW
jgi:hypothetical protein